MKIPPHSKETIGVVKENLEIGRNSIIQGEGTPPKIIVEGIIICRGRVLFEADVEARSLEGEEDNVEVRGNLTVENSISIEDGSLYVHGNLQAANIEVDNSLRVRGTTKAEEIKVGGSLETTKEIVSNRIIVGGSFEAESDVKAEKIKVGGSLEIKGKVSVKDIDVGGSVELSSGEVNGSIKVGGTLEAEDFLKFGEIKVGGAVKMATGEGATIKVGGTLEIDEDIKFEKIKVGGTVKIRGKAEGESIIVGGTLNAKQSIKLENEFSVGGTAEIRDSLEASYIKVGGTLKADEVKGKNVSIGGSVKTLRGIRAERFEIGKRGEVIGPIYARVAIIGRRANVEDVYAEEIRMKRGSSARNLHGKRIYIDDECRIYGEIKYTEELVTGEHVSFAKSPEKVDSLENI